MKIIFLIILTLLICKVSSSQSLSCKPRIDYNNFFIQEDSIIQQDIIKHAYYEIIDSLAAKYNFIPNNNLDNCYSNFKLFSSISRNYESKIPNKFDYKNSIRITNAKGSKDIARIDVYYKDLYGMALDYDSLKRNLSKPYTYLFNIFGDNDLDKVVSRPSTNTIFIIESISKQTVNIEFVRNFFTKILLGQQQKLNYTLVEKFSVKPPSIQIKMIFNEEQDGVKLHLDIFSNSIRLIDKDNNQIQTDFFISKSEFMEKDFSYLYGRIVNFIYKLTKTNF